MKEQKEDSAFGILRLAVFVVAAGLVFITVIAGVGWIIGWRTSVEYSNGFFIVGAITAVFGAYSALGGLGMRGHPGVNVARTASPASLEERNRQMFKDMKEGNNFAVVMVIVGLLLIGFAMAIPSLFG